MKNYILKRIVSIIPIIIGITFFTFLLLQLRGSDPAEIALRVNKVKPTEETINSLRKELGLNHSLPIRYINWLKDIIKGDFGKSFITNRPVINEFKRALPATLYLSTTSLILIITISLITGVLCVIFENRTIDKLLRGIIFLGSAVPNFWMGTLLVWLFAVKLNLLNTSGMERIDSVILPAFTLSLVYISTYTRLIRNTMIKNKYKDYMIYLKMKGLKQSTLIKHLLKNSLRPTITALGMSIPKLIAGSFIVESIFAWPGIGRLCVTAIFNSDYPIIQAYVLIIALLFVILNLIVDIFNAYLDPRIRKES